MYPLDKIRSPKGGPSSKLIYYYIISAPVGPAAPSHTQMAFKNSSLVGKSIGKYRKKYRNI